MPARIAVVDDDDLFRDLMRDLLGPEGHVVVAYPAAACAYPALKADLPDLAILDVRVESPDAGWQLLELLRLDPATATLPLLVCTADALFLQAHAAGLRARGCAVLAKPFDLDELLGAVGEALAPP
jgi:CheY-like chemotaxis protein